MPKNETIVACGVRLGMFRAKARPGNICFSCLSLELRIIKMRMLCACMCENNETSKRHIPKTSESADRESKDHREYRVARV